MLSKPIEPPLFTALEKHLFSYAASMDLLGHRGVQVRIKGGGSRDLEFAATALKAIDANGAALTTVATEVFYGAYEAIKDAVENDGYRIEDEGGALPAVEAPLDVWKHLVLEEVVVDRKYGVRLGFRAPWDVEHDLGVYWQDGRFFNAGVSV
jgi:hypothetical protein